MVLRPRVSALMRVTGRTTFAEFLDGWLERKIREGCKSGLDYASLIRNHFLADPKKPRGRKTPSGLPALGSRQMQHLRPRLVREWLDGLRASQYSTRYQRNIFALLHNTLGDARRRGFIRTNPCDDIDKRQELPKVKDLVPGWRERGVYSLAEARQILEADIPLRWLSLYAFLFYTGCRIGEALAVRWSDIAWDSQPLPAITLIRGFNSKSGKIAGTKTDAVKKVPMHPGLRPFLEAWKQAPPEPPVKASKLEMGLVFPSARGGCMRSSTVLQRLQSDLDDLGLRRRTLHNIRASFITWTTDAKCNPEWIKRITHPPPSTVMDGYRRPAWEALCSELEKLKL